MIADHFEDRAGCKGAGKRFSFNRTAPSGTNGIRAIRILLREESQPPDQSWADENQTVVRRRG